MYNYSMKQIELMGFNINAVSMYEAIEISRYLIDLDKVTHIITINPEMYEIANEDYEFAQIIRWADLVVPDGIGITLALRIMGHKVSRLTGIDLGYRLLKEAAANGIPVAFVGAKNHVIENAVKNLQSKIPDLNIVYYHDGYFDNPMEIYEGLKQASPKLILVGMGAPYQEKFINNAKKIINPALMIGVGGSFDVWAGEVKRAPKIYQKLGLEWLYRTLNEPYRITRIFPALPLFLIRVINKRLGEKV